MGGNYGTAMILVFLVSFSFEYRNLRSSACWTPGTLLTLGSRVLVCGLWLLQLEFFLIQTARVMVIAT